MVEGDILRAKIEPYVDRFHRQFPLLARPRDLALAHLLRCFEDLIAQREGLRAVEGAEFRSWLALRLAQDGLAWAVRWVWDECPTFHSGGIDLDWDAYEEAGHVLLHANDYYHLYRCFVLYSRGHFTATVDSSGTVVRFSFASDVEERLDAARQLREVAYDTSRPRSARLQAFRAQVIELLSAELPQYLERIDDNSLRYRIPAEVWALFMRWAALESRELRFDLPGRWQLGEYSLHQFRSFWKVLLSLSYLHSSTRGLAETVGVKGGAIGSIVLQLPEAGLEELGQCVPIQRDACRAIIRDLSYDPQGAFWDAIWQPLFRLGDGTLLISPSLIMTSSPERNLIALLNRTEGKRELYNRLSGEKERGQLAELASMFSADHFVIRHRVSVRRGDGTRLSDIDLLVFDRRDACAMLIQAKWLLRPDYVTEVLAKDQEINAAIAVTNQVWSRVEELGPRWLADVLECDLLGADVRICALLVNKDFLPSGWIHDSRIPCGGRDLPSGVRWVSRVHWDTLSLRGGIRT